VGVSGVLSVREMACELCIVRQHENRISEDGTAQDSEVTSLRECDQRQCVTCVRRVSIRCRCKYHKCQ
jgi:hypothetical protein